MIKKNETVEGCEGITLMEFGTGDIGVTFVMDSDYSGVLFKNQKPVEIGTPENLGNNMTIQNFTTEVMMTFTKVESIDVVIHNLELAKAKLLNLNKD